jgi:hypothetical protein
MVPEHRAHTVLNTWQDVASYLGVSVRTAQTWEKTLGLPIRRTPGRRGRIVADPAELDRWRFQAAAPSAKRPEIAKARLLIFVGLVAGMVALLLILLIQLRSGPTPSLSHAAQITHSGFTKFAPVVSDGKQLFFTEQQNGRYWISTVPIGGGMDPRDRCRLRLRDRGRPYWRALRGAQSGQAAAFSRAVGAAQERSRGSKRVLIRVAPMLRAGFG